MDSRWYIHTYHPRKDVLLYFLNIYFGAASLVDSSDWKIDQRLPRPNIYVDSMAVLCCRLQYM
jgi:hypothetical protein